jgi:hypothetical protein
MATITREQFADYQKRFMPVESELQSYYDNPAKMAEGIGAARTYSGKAADAATENVRLGLSRYGQAGQMDDPAFSRQLSLNKAAADVDAANSARAHIVDRDNKILAGGLTTRGM